MVDIAKHPLLREAYELCIAIEECGCSEKLTAASVKASNLLQSIDGYLAAITGEVIEIDENGVIHPVGTNLANAVLRDSQGGN